MKLQQVIRKLFYTIGFISVVTSCSTKTSNEDKFTLDISAAAEKLQSNSDLLRLDTITNFEWDKLFIFTPYTPLENIEKALGAPSPTAIESTRIYERDDVNLLVFIKNNLVVEVFTLPRDIVDFSFQESVGSLSHQTAVFVKSSDGNTLVPVNSK